MSTDLSKNNIKVYRPNTRYELGLMETCTVMLKNILCSKELIWQLFKRDFFARYRKSFLGSIWVLIMPVIGIISWLFIKKAGVLSPGKVGVPYVVYILVGTTMWGLFMGFYTSATKTLSSVSNIVKQVNFPHEAIIAKQAALHLANFSVAIALNFLVILYFGITPSWTWVFFPLVILPMFFLGTAIGLIISMMSVVVLDIERGTTTLMGLLFFSVPVIYSSSVKTPWLKTLITYNPLTHIVCSARDLLIHGTLYDTTGFLVCAAGSLLLFLISCRLFYVAEGKVIERML